MLPVGGDLTGLSLRSLKKKLGMHQVSAFSPLLFVTVMEAISREFRVAMPWKLYADDSVVIAETK